MFGALSIGERFTWLGSEYTKLEPQTLKRYGAINCQGPRCYDGDMGTRFLYDDIEVEPFNAEDEKDRAVLDELQAGDLGGKLDHGAQE